MVARKYCYLMLIPVAAYFIIFCYVPMYGLLISFQNYKVFKGIWGSEWVGLQNFRDFINGRQFWPVIGNTLILNLESLCFTFTMPILFALLLNELRSARFCKTIQTITYMPHFISTVVVVSMMQMLLSPTNGIRAGVPSFIWLPLPGSTRYTTRRLPLTEPPGGRRS